jgi:hypothetical protein
MPVKRRRYPGDPAGGPPKPIPQRKPGRLDVYSVFWKDIEDKSKGTIWIYHSIELMKAGQLRGDPDIPFRQIGHRPSLTKARGKKWTAIYSDDEHYEFLASPMMTKRLIATIAGRWPNPPIKFRPDKGPAFSLVDLQDENHSHVYLVQLLTFHKTVNGQHYYKIGKAKSVPKRIKQFGPCRLIISIKLPSEQISLKVESDIHAKFNHLRRPDTEIFCMTDEDLQFAIDEYVLQETKYAN